MRLAIVISRYNTEVTDGLLSGALHYLKEQRIAFGDADLFEAPGAYEIPLIAQQVARRQDYDGVICLGCVIKGETAHFEYISEAVARGLMQAGLETGVPLSFGVLTTYTEEQAVARSQTQDLSHNKGIEAARSCHLAVLQIKKINKAN